MKIRVGKIGERHTDGGGLAQEIEIEIEVTKTDLENMRSMQADAA